MSKAAAKMEDTNASSSGQVKSADLLRFGSSNSAKQRNICYDAAALHSQFRGIAGRHQRNGKVCSCLNHLIDGDDLSKATALLHSAQMYLLHNTDDTATNTKMDHIFSLLRGE